MVAYVSDEILQLRIISECRSKYSSVANRFCLHLGCYYTRVKVVSLSFVLKHQSNLRIHLG